MAKLEDVERSLAARPLVARTCEIDEEIDVLHVIGEDGVLFESADHSLAGSGQALRLDLTWSLGELGGMLRSITDALADLDSTASSEPVAFVSVPFSSEHTVTAIVPEVTVRQDGTGTATITTVGDAHLPIRFEASSYSEIPHQFSLSPTIAPKQWCDAVDEAIRRMRASELQKVVLAREVIIEADAPFSQVSAIRQLRRAYPTAYRFAFDGFIGASPELLIERNDFEIRAQMLAGTAPRSSDTIADEALRTALLRSGKDRTEHRYLSDMVTETLRPFTDSLDIPAIPSIMSLANVHHLATPMHGTLSSSNTSVLDLVAALHPTPAVGGRPTEKAVALIEELEDLDRGRYAGAIGWVDANGNGRFAVAIRCAQLQGTRARLYAGNGIVAASHAQRELEETQWKLQAMLSALVRP